MGWVDELASIIGYFLPKILLVSPDEKAVLERKGKIRRDKGNKGTVGKGIYFLYPIVDEYRKRKVTSQVVDMPDVIATTQDKRTLTISSSIEYEIKNLERALYLVSELDESIQAVSIGLIPKAVGQIKWESENSIGNKLSKIEKIIGKGMEKKEKAWGIQVTEVWVNRFGRSRSIDLTHHGDGSFSR